MDVSSAVLDNLMGRDRNKLLDNVTQRDHYSNPDVCKSFLVCFCFNTLFPNTTYDQGPCQKRHDTYLKNMFDNDPSRAQYERQYIRECIHWIQRRLQEVQKKTKQNQSVIDNKSNFPTDRPKQILDRILAIQADIQKLIKDSQKYGQEGKIDDSLRCLEEVEKLRQRRKQIELMGSDMTNAQKQQKICFICGAIQTINDTQKRIQTHLEGKIHQGFLKLRHQVEALKIRLQILNKLNPPQKKQRQQHEKKRQRQRQEYDRKREEHDRKKEQKKQQIEKKVQKPKEPQPPRNTQIRQQRQQRDRSDSASRRRKKQRSKQRERSRQRRQRHQDRDRTKDVKQKDRHSRSKDRKEKKHHRDSRDRDTKERSHKEHKESKEHKKKHKKNKSRSKERDYQNER